MVHFICTLGPSMLFWLTAISTSTVHEGNTNTELRTSSQLWPQFCPWMHRCLLCMGCKPELWEATLMPKAPPSNPATPISVLWVLGKRRLLTGIHSVLSLDSAAQQGALSKVFSTRSEALTFHYPTHPKLKGILRKMTKMFTLAW